MQTIFSKPTFIRSIDQSIALNKQRGPMIVISASGMLTGGRVLHHMKAFGTHPQNLILLVGYQVPGTRGGDLLAGKRTLKIHGEHYRIQAQVKMLDMFSAHADQEELVQWLQQVKRPPEKLFLVHGDGEASNELRLKIEQQKKWPVEVPYFKQTYQL
ncbi:MAG: MBL fold metallo-hydrolase [Bdellovibrionota bacterium]